jgi:repressor LexA
MSDDMSLGKKLREIRESLHLTQDELAAKSGLGRQYIAALETDDIAMPGADKMMKLAKGTGRSLAQLNAELLGIGTPEEILSLREVPLARIPIIGSVPAGYPDIREEHISGYLNVPREELRGVSLEGLYVLKVTGESLVGDDVHDGDYVVYNTKNKEVVNGKIYICLVGDEVVAKHVVMENSHVRLVSSNPRYKDIELSSVEILGRVILSSRYHEH